MTTDEVGGLIAVGEPGPCTDPSSLCLWGIGPSLCLSFPGRMRELGEVTSKVPPHPELGRGSVFWNIEGSRQVTKPGPRGGAGGSQVRPT